MGQGPDSPLKDSASEVCRLMASDGPQAAQTYVRDEFQGLWFERLQGAEDEFIHAATMVSCPDQ